MASSSHMYGEVQSVNLRNLNTFVVQYLHAEHDYVYRSPIAVQIVHEISFTSNSPLNSPLSFLYLVEL